MTRILFLSNGHGEDLIAATIIRELQKTISAEITAMPIVGVGKVFDALGISVIGPRRAMPSGGFVYLSLWHTIKDIASGLIGTTISQIRTLLSLRGSIDLTVAVGDVVPIYGAFLAGAPFLFYGCAKSDYFNYSYNGWELWLLKKFCRKAFARDVKTAKRFTDVGIRSEFVGNPMMDGFDITGETFGLPQDDIVIGILPGTRDDVWINLNDIMDMLPTITRDAPRHTRVAYLVAMASHLRAEEVQQLACVKSGSAKFHEPSMDQRARGIVSILLHEGTPLYFVKDKFGDVISRAQAVIGLAGTGNEQAIGLGKPVISFGGRGVQHTLKFAQSKKELLGDSISLVPATGEAVSKEIWGILENPRRLAHMRAVGAERMGPPGAAARLVTAIAQELGNRS